MVFSIHHIHLKTHDPRSSAEWFVKALNFHILADLKRDAGDRLIRCTTEDGASRVNFSNERTGESLPECVVGVHFGIEHICVNSKDLPEDIDRLVALGAQLDEGQQLGKEGQTTVFLITPDGIRLELGRIDIQRIQITLDAS
jgi:lactoylglutathione lyase